MNVLVACEYSGTVRDAFARNGHYAISADLLDTESDFCSELAGHYQGDVFDVVDLGWDMMIAFPPCTHLAVSGARWFPQKRADGRQQEAIDFFMKVVNAPIPHIAIENPVGIMSTEYRTPDQYVQPWEYGHGETKKTCLWLKNLPLLKPTEIVEGRENRIWKMGPSPTRGKERSKSYPGIAQAMADQWGERVPQKG